MAIGDAFEKARNAMKRWMARRPDLRTPEGAQATFRLVFNGLTIGVLTVRNGRWTFQYSDEFRQRRNLRPITEFPDVSRIYESQDLWPFFGMRIPSLNQASVRQIIRKEQLDETDEVQLLRRFGKRTISNPFELIETGSK
jgi:HipA-like protein